MNGRDLVSSVLKTETIETLSGFIDYFTENEFLKRNPPPADDSIRLFNIRVRQIKKTIGDKRIDEVTIRDISKFLDILTNSSSNQARGYLVDIFKHAVARGYCADNPAACTIKKPERKRRKRHTVAGLKSIRDSSPQWLKNAIDLALITAQQREEIVTIKFDDIKDNYLYIVQNKTEKHTDAGWIRFELTPQLKNIIAKCRDNVPSPFLIHHKPARRKPAKKRVHWTQILVDYLTRAFKDARDKSGAYAEMEEDERPTFHEIRALSIKLYKSQGKDAQKIAGHANKEMTLNYLKDHDEIVWSDAVPDLDISKII